MLLHTFIHLPRLLLSPSKLFIHFFLNVLDRILGIFEQKYLNRTMVCLLQIFARNQTVHYISKQLYRTSASKY